MKRIVVWTGGGEQPLCEALGRVPGIEVLRAADRSAALAAMRDADGLVTSVVHWAEDFAHALRKAERLVWVQILNAGFDNMERLGVPDGVTVSTIGDIGSGMVAEHAVGLLLALLRGLPAAFDAQSRREWHAGPVIGAARALHGLDVAVVGFGHIGRGVARLARAFGARVVAFARAARSAGDGIEVRALDALLGSLPAIEAIVICIPLNAATEKLLNAAAFAAMRPGTYLVNVSRGGIVETPALVEALRAGVVAGAALDVTDPEPPPPGHPLWTLPNVILTPHTAWAGGGPDQAHRLRELVVDNAARFARGDAVLNAAVMRRP